MRSNKDDAVIFRTASDNQCTQDGNSKHRQGSSICGPHMWEPQGRNQRQQGSAACSRQIVFSKLALRATAQEQQKICPPAVQS